MRGLAGKRIVVASGATGIGAATAQRLAEEGAQLVVGDINEGELQATVSRIRAAGGTAEAVRFDLADPPSIEALIQACVERFGGLDGLAIVGADIGMIIKEMGQDLLTMDLAVWDRTLQVNLIGHALAIRAALPHLIKAGGGAIVGVSSGAAYGGFAEMPAYAVSKAALNALARHVAQRWGKDNIRCNYIAPGWILSESARRSLDQGKHDAILSALPLPRLGEPADTAALLAFLLSDDAEWITGQILSINGGAAFRE
jgi:NAD(P)-dependent dehydrogenase (short-subunit alcohol dehydrogenase family)